MDHDGRAVEEVNVHALQVGPDGRIADVLINPRVERRNRRTSVLGISPNNLHGHSQNPLAIICCLALSRSARFCLAFRLTWDAVASSELSAAKLSQCPICFVIP